MPKCQLVKTGENTFMVIGDDINVEMGELITVSYTADNQRTQQQNAAMHLYFKHLMQAFNDAGLDQRKVFEAMKEGVMMPWTELTIKENFWRPFQQAIVGKKSTTKLDKEEVSKIHMVIDSWTLERLNISVPFPDKYWRVYG